MSFIYFLMQQIKLKYLCRFGISIQIWLDSTIMNMVISLAGIGIMRQGIFISEAQICVQFPARDLAFLPSKSLRHIEIRN